MTTVDPVRNAPSSARPVERRAPTIELPPVAVDRDPVQADPTTVSPGPAPAPATFLSVLMVDGDRVLTQRIRRDLGGHGCLVSIEHSRSAGFSHALHQPTDVIVLGVQLPDGNGIDLVRSLRRQGLTTPILLHSSHSDDRTVVVGLDAGADDFVAKPATVEVLAARLRALHRRCDHPLTAPIRVGELVLEHSKLEARRAGVQIDLTPAQAGVLWVMMRNVGQVLTREQIDEHLRNGEQAPKSNVVDVHIRALRAKIDKPFEAPMIQTVRGVGYRLLKA